jgi:uncharacterized protein YdeI (YjbR/CyaY-like superfamily)
VTSLPGRHPKDGWPVLAFATQDELLAWLDEHHDSPVGAWFVMAKKGRGIASVTLEEVTEALMAVGWVDSKGQRIDDDYWAVRAHVRRPRSPWSEPNKRRVEKLTAEGRMRPSGQAQVDAAKADGRWGS